MTTSNRVMFNGSRSSPIPKIVRHKLGFLYINCDGTNIIPLNMARVSLRLVSFHINTLNVGCPISEKDRVSTQFE